MPQEGSQPPRNYKVKLVPSFLGRNDVRILCQNENGPCPLLAIANILSLRNELSLPPDEVSHQALLSLVASAILDASARSAAGSSHQADLQANVQDALEVLEVLGKPGSTGMDVNLRFNSPLGFEPTRELAAFDLLGISLVHGWLVDPQDVHTAEAVGSCTYNQAVELIISALDGTGASQAVSRHASFVASKAGTPSRQGPSPLYTTPSQQQQQRQQEEGDLLGLGDSGAPSVAATAAAPQVDLLGDLLGGDVPAPAASPSPSPAPPPAGQQQQQQQQPGDAAAELGMFEGLSLQEEGAAAAAAAAAGAGARAGTASPAPGQSRPPALQSAGASGPAPALGGDGAQARRVNQALLVREFLDLNASQLTVYGISQIASSLPDNKLAVFFRNNHFNVLFKHGRSLFLLVTDQGYLGVREVVWERLDTVDGDTQLCGPDFLPHKARAQVPRSTQAPAMNLQALAAIPPEALAGLSEADAAAIAEAAGVFLPPPASNAAAPPATGGAGGAQGVGPQQQPAQHQHQHQQPGGHNEDADLALAMQLQEEEDRQAYEAEQQQQRASHQAAVAAQQQQQQYQQQQQQQQQQQFHQDAYQPIPQHQQQRPAQQRPAAGRAAVPPAAQESKKDSSCVLM